MELIKIGSTGGMPTVDGRDLHALLEVGKDFSTWMKDRIEKYGFQEGEDYMVISRPPIPGAGNRGAGFDYFLSLDMSKELSMVENNAQGRKVRQYFIEVEKQHRALLNTPKTYAEALRALADETERVEALNSKLLEQKPKVDFYDTVIDAQGAFDFGVATKMLKYKNLGRNKLMEILRNKKILQSGGKTKNVPYQQFIDKGYFIVNENSFEDSFGNVHITYTTMVTQKGVDAIKKSIDKMVEEGELVLEEETSFFDLE